MSEIQASKAVVRRFYDAMDSKSPTEITDVLKRYTANDYLWRGMHPFYEIEGAETVAESFWKPLRVSFPFQQRRQDIFMASANALDEGKTVWVCSMGHLMGLFDEQWLGIPPTGKLAFLRYVEFHRVAGDVICETAMFFDVLDLMHQAGVYPLPPQTGAQVVQPGPRTHDGLLFDAQDPREGTRTLDLTNRMAADLVASDLHSDREELATTWHEDMLWFGPAGIGATFTIDRYERQHQGPFRAGLENFETELGSNLLIAEGNYSGLMSWSNFSMNASGGFMGLPASERRTEMRVVDVYRREGDKLAENWIFIDLLHFLALQGLDVLGRMREIGKPPG